MSKQKPGDQGGRVVARNKEARRRWEISDTVEAGMELTGTEVKAIREGKVQLADSYAVVKGAQIFLLNLHIGPYPPAGPYAQHQPTRTRRLLLKRAQIEKLIGQMAQKGYSLVPLDVHFRGAWAKVELGLARGKKTEDRREEIKKRTAEREMARAFKR